MMIFSPGSPLEPILDEARRFARSEATVLVTGETGTGKEVFARIIHENSPRSSGAFVAVNCGAIPESLIEAELFGHVKGAFTGAHAARKGRVALAHGGTLFLDELGELSLPMQVKLLRLLQEKTYEPVGSSEPQKADFRLVAATNRSLADELIAGRFRSDLYYRIFVCPLHLPPLRERGVADLKALFFSFWKKLGDGRSVDDGVFACMSGYPWPGNVRELENFVERLAVCARGDVIVPDDVPLSYRNQPVGVILTGPLVGRAEDVSAAVVDESEQPEHDWLDSLPGPAEPSVSLPSSVGTGVSPTSDIRPQSAVEPGDSFRLPIDLGGHLEKLERGYIEAALQATGGNKQASADLLGLQRTTLVAKCKKFGLEDGGRFADQGRSPVGLRIDIEEEDRPVLSLRGASFKIAVIREDVIELVPLDSAAATALDRSPVAGSVTVDGENLRVFGALNEGANGFMTLQLAIPLERSQLVSLQRSMMKRRPRAAAAARG
jgi:sigma-54 specific flagellar transcriptional regulator A